MAAVWDCMSMQRKKKLTGGAATVKGKGKVGSANLATIFGIIVLEVGIMPFGIIFLEACFRPGANI